MILDDDEIKFPQIKFHFILFSTIKKSILTPESFLLYNIPYIGNRSRKKMFADFANLDAFETIFLTLFVVMKNLKQKH